MMNPDLTIASSGELLDCTDEELHEDWSINDFFDDAYAMDNDYFDDF